MRGCCGQYRLNLEPLDFLPIHPTAGCHVLMTGALELGALLMAVKGKTDKPLARDGYGLLLSNEEGCP